MAYSRRSYRRRPRRTVRRRLQSKGKRARYAGVGKAVYDGVRLGYKAANWYTGKKRGRGSSSSEASMSKRLAMSGMNDYKKASYKLGRRISAAARGRRLLKDNTQFRKLGLRNYGPWNRGTGNIHLVSAQEGLIDTEVMQPVHLWDLTAMPQAYVQTGSSNRWINWPATFFRLVFSRQDENGYVNWKKGAAADNVTLPVENDSTITPDKAYELYPIDTNGPLYATANNQTANEQWQTAQSFIESASAKLLCYGPPNAPTKYLIQLVQLSEDVALDKQDEKATAFWQAIAKPFGYSPLEDANRNLISKNMKVLKSISFSLDAPESSEDHLSARMRQINLFAFLNRKANYNWDYNTDRVSLDAPDTFENAETEIKQYATTVHPKARVYLMIRAMTTYQGPEAIDVQSSAPSYDITLSVTHRTL